MSLGTFELREITRLDDPTLPQVLDLFQQSFPLREQMPLSWWIELMVQKESGNGADRHLVALVSGDRAVAFAYWEEGDRADYLWYLASRADSRGNGIGASLYADIAARAFDRGRSLVFEVELPEEAARMSAEDGAWARRRIDWYRRNGAMLLGGVEYIQDVGWQPAYPMAVMIASREALSPSEAYSIVSSTLGNEVRRVAPLTLT